MIDAHGTIYVDNSTLKAAARCDTMATLRYAAGYTTREEKVAADCGTAFHEALALYMQGQNDAAVLAKFEEIWHEPSHRLIPDDPKHYGYARRWDNASIILEEWLLTNPLNTQPFGQPNDGMVEVGLQVPLGDRCVCGGREADHTPFTASSEVNPLCKEFRHRFVYVGRLDAIVQSSHDRLLYVLDHKTTAGLDSRFVKKYENDSQMTGYAWAAQETLGQPISGIFINAIELKKVPNSNRKCKEHGVQYEECGRLHLNSRMILFQRTPEQLDAWKETALKLAEQWRTLLLASQLAGHQRVPVADSIKAVSMQGMFTEGCTYCEFRDWCCASKAPDYFDTMFTHSPWRPFELPVDAKETTT